MRRKGGGKEEEWEGREVSLNISNLISMWLVKKEHPGLYNNCQ
jgi:hypothetical protein